MSQTFTVPVVAYFNVEIEATDPEAAIQQAERMAEQYMPMTIGDFQASGPAQCVDHDRVWDQYEEDVDE